MSEVPWPAEELVLEWPGDQPLTFDRNKVAAMIHAVNQPDDYPEGEAFTPFVQMLAACVANPAYWDVNGPEFMGILVLYGAIALHYSSDWADEDRFIELYDYFVSKAPVELRAAVVRDLTRQLPPAADTRSLAAITDCESDLRIAKEAAQAVARLVEPLLGDELSGVSGSTSAAMRLRLGGETAGAIIPAALLELGDERISAMLSDDLNGSWSRLTPEQISILASLEPPMIAASAVEFLLQWLETTDATGLDVPAQALAQLARCDNPAYPGVWMLHWSFPSPPALDDDPDSGAQPEVAIHWDREAFAQVIEPRLRLAYARNVESTELSRAMTAWGREAGPANAAEQRRLAQEVWRALAARLQGAFASDTVEDLEFLDVRAVNELAQAFTRQTPQDALRHALEALDNRCALSPNSEHYAEQLAETGAEEWRVLQFAFGPDPCAVLRAMVALDAADKLEAERQADPAGLRLLDREFSARFNQLVQWTHSHHTDRTGTIWSLRRSPEPDMGNWRWTRLQNHTSIEETLARFRETATTQYSAELQSLLILAVEALLTFWPAETAAVAVEIGERSGESDVVAARAKDLNDAAMSAWSEIDPALDRYLQTQPDEEARKAVNWRTKELVGAVDWIDPANQRGSWDFYPLVANDDAPRSGKT